MNDNNDYSRFINDCSARSIIEKKKTGRFSIKNTLKFETSVRSAKSFKTLNPNKTRNVFKNVSFARFQINFWNYIPKINPLGQFRIMWDIFVGTSTLYLFFAISVSLSFAKLILLDYLTVFIGIFIGGILIDLNTGFYEQGIFVRNRRAAALNYLRKYFVFDLISTLCLIEQYFSEDLQYVIILFFLKVQYFTKISKIFKEVLHIKPIYHSIVSFCKLIGVIIFAAHFFACIYITMVTFFNFTNNWVAKQGLDIESQVFQVYLRAFYYSCVTMLTVGYGDVTPQNDLEYSVVILTILIGCMFFGYSLNKIGTIFNEMEEQDKKILKNLFIINQYMSRKDIQKDLQFQVREYLTYYWSQNNSTENKASEHIISQLSEGLKQKLQIQATRKVLNQCPIFRQNFTDEFLQKASTLIKEYRCYPDEIITFQGDVDDCSIFFVEQGTAVMYFQGNSNHLGKNDTSIDIKELRKGDTFGFYSFFTGQPRKLTIRSAGFTSLLLIERGPFIKLIRCIKLCQKNHFQQTILNKEYQQDYEIFCTICDNLLTGFEYQQVHSDCYCCQYNDHMITDCPKIHLVVDKIELSQRDMKQIRDYKFERRLKRYHPILDESEANLFIQSQLFYLQAYHQLFIGAFDNWFDHDDEDDEDELDDLQYQLESNDKVSLKQEKQKKNESQLSALDEEVLKQHKKPSIPTQRTQEKRISLIPPDQVKQAIESLIYIPDQKQAKEINDMNINKNINKQGNFFNSNQNKKTKTTSLTRIKNPSFSQQTVEDQQNMQQFQINQLQQNQLQNSTNSNYLQQQQTSNVHETSVKQFASFFTDQNPSLQINVITNEQENTTAFLSPHKSKKKSLGESSMTDIEKIQQMIAQQSQQMQQQQIQAQQTQNLTQSTMTNIQPFQIQNSNQQQTFQYILQKQSQLFSQQCQQQQQFIQQQMQQLIQLINNNSPNSISNNTPNNQGGWSPITSTPQNLVRRRSSVAVHAQQNFQSQVAQNSPYMLNYSFAPAQQNELSHYGKSNNSLPNLTANEFFKQYSQNSKIKQMPQQQQTIMMHQGDKMMLLQKLNNTSQFFIESLQEDDCKMKLFTHYFPDWNVNVILQKINLENGFSVNSSEILQTTDHKGIQKYSLKQKGQGKIQQDHTISNKRVTSIIYQNANEKKVQEVLSNLNQVGTRGIDESHANDPNQLNLPAIPTYIRDQKKGNTVIIPSIQEQNQQLAALKFTHQSINDKFIVFRKNNPQNQDQEQKQKNFLTSEFLTDHTEKLKAMKRKSISVDVDIMKKLRPHSNIIAQSPNESQNNKSIINSFSINPQTKQALSGDFTIPNLDFSENVNDLNEESNIPLSINSYEKQPNHSYSWAQYINQKL